MIDVGDVVTLSVEVRDADNNLANAGTMTLTVTAPDGTVGSPATITPTSTGVYSATTTAAEGLHDVLWTATGANAGKHRDCFMAGPYLPLVSIADLISALGSGYVAADADRLRDTLAAASAVIEAHRPVRRRTATWTAGGGRNAIALPWKPVQSITSVVESGVTLSASDYVLDPTSCLLHRGSTGYGTWTSGIANVVVTAVVGYNAPPRLAMEATIEQARHMWETRRGGAARGGQFGGAEDGYIPGAAHLITYRAAELLDRIEPADSLPGFA
jgi:hypothetical protein